MDKKLFRVLLTLLTIFVSAKAQGAAFSFPELDTTMTDPIFRTLAGGFIFRSAEPASDLGKKFGLYLGASVSGVDTSAVSTIFSGFSSPLLPSGDLQIGVGFPAGFVLEVGFLPSFNFSGTSIGNYGVGVKWNATRNFLSKLPFSLSGRIGYSSSSISFAQQINSVDVTVSYGSTVLTAQALVSKKLFIFEPYFGLGLANHSSSLASSGSASLFGSTFPVGTQNYSASGLFPWIQAGLLLDFVLLGIGAEYDSVFGLSSYTGKVSLRF